MAELARSQDMSPDREIVALKGLLFGPEAQKLAEVAEGLRRLDARVGTPEHFETATTEILVDAFRRTEASQHRELAQAMAPLVVASIRNEIKNSRDAMVEALYPITGRLVAAAVSNGLREIVEKMNERMDSFMSLRWWRRKLRSLVTGQPMSALAMADTSRRQVQRLLFIGRGSGQLVAHWRGDGGTDENPELVSGLIAAVSDFANQVLGQNRELRTLDLGHTRLFLRSSATTIIAAECDGVWRPEDERALDREMLGLLERLEFGDVLQPDVLAATAGRLAENDAPPPAPGIGKHVLRAIVVLLALGLVWWAWNSFARWRVETSVERALSGLAGTEPEISPYPVAAFFDHAASRIILRGLVPSGARADALVKTTESAAPGYAVARDLAIVASEASLLASTEQARRDQAALADAARQMQSALAEQRAAIVEQRAALAQQAAAFAEQKAELARNAGETADRLAGLSSSLVPKPVEAFMSLAQSSAIYFTGELSLRNEATAKAKLDALAKSMKAFDFSLRILGHSDATGNAQKNRDLSRRRADFIAGELSARGIARERLVVVSRAANEPVSDENAPNRRVTFEMVPLDETQP